MYNYIAFGCHIASALQLPELQAVQPQSPDVSISLGTLDWQPHDVDADGTRFIMSDGDALLLWQDIGAYRVRGGTTIVVDAAPGVEERLLRLPLLGTVFAVLLHQRSNLVLHASAIAVGQRVAVFVGDKGQGKSTMAAALYAHRNRLVADDMVALDIENIAQPLVQPGFPQFKLWPEAVRSALGDDPTALVPLAEGIDKRARRITERFAQARLPLGAIFVLGIGPAIDCRRLPPQAALVQLITHTYVARFDNQLLQGMQGAAHLQCCAALIGSVPVYRLERPRALELLPSIVDLVEAQLAAPALSGA